MKGKILTSDPCRQRFLAEQPVTFTPRDPDGNSMIKVFPQHLLQRVDGFGGSFTESAGVVYNSMTAASKVRFLRWYFAPEEHHYHLARMPIQSCDFSLSNYACVSGLEDLAQGTLTFHRDKEYLMPMIADALAINPQMTLMASPWSPPACLKSNANMNGGGKLRPEHYRDWAQLIVEYLLEYQRHGIRIRSLSIQNEPVAVKPWDSCLYSVEEVIWSS